MSRRNYTQELEYGVSKGIDLTTPLSQLAPGFLREANNANLGTTGGYEKRKGYVAQLGTIWSNLRIDNAIEFKNSTLASPERIFFGVGADGRLGKQVGSAIVETGFPTGLPITSKNRVAFAQIEDRLFLFNGDSTNMPSVYDGEASRSLALSVVPTVALSAGVPGGSGFKLSEGSYIFTYTWAIRHTPTNKMIFESIPAPLTTVNTTAAWQSVALTIPNSGVTYPNNVSLAVVIRLYRTVVNGTVPFLEAELVPVGGPTTPYTSNSVSDEELDIDQLEQSNERLIDFVADGYNRAHFPAVARNRLFVVSSKLNEIRFSKISQHGPMPETFPALNFVSTEGIHGSTDRVTGLGSINGTIVVLKQRSVGILEEVGLPEITRAEDSTTYVYRELTGTVGAIGHWAQVNVLNELIFLGSDGIYATDGAQIRSIGTPIQALLRQVAYTPALISRVSMGNDTRNRRILIQIFDSAAAVRPNLTIVGDYQLYPDFRWTLYTKGPNETTWPGIQASSFFQFTDSVEGTLDLYFGNAGLNLGSIDQRGQYFKLNTGNADDDQKIYFKLISRPYPMEQPLLTKLYKRVFLLAEATEEVNLELCTAFNLEKSENFCAIFTIAGSGTNWDDANWDDDLETDPEPLIWGDTEQKELVHNSHRKAKFMQIIIKQVDKDAPVTIFGWGTSASLFPNT